MKNNYSLCILTLCHLNIYAYNDFTNNQINPTLNNQNPNPSRTFTGTLLSGDTLKFEACVDPKDNTQLKEYSTSLSLFNATPSQEAKIHLLADFKSLSVKISANSLFNDDKNYPVYKIQNQLVYPIYEGSISIYQCLNQSNQKEKYCLMSIHKDTSQFNEDTLLSVLKKDTLVAQEAEKYSNQSTMGKVLGFGGLALLGLGLLNSIEDKVDPITGKKGSQFNPSPLIYIGAGLSAAGAIIHPKGIMNVANLDSMITRYNLIHPH